MFFLKFISPNYVPTELSRWTIGHKVYRQLLKAYLRFYVKGVILDHYVVNDVEVFHSVCDEWFEKEIHRFNLNSIPSFIVVQHEPYIKRRYHRYSCFSWEEQLKIVHKGQCCCTIHGNHMKCTSEIEGILKISANKDFALCFDFIAQQRGGNTERKEKSSKTPQEKLKERLERIRNETTTEPSPKPSPKKKKIHIKDDMSSPNHHSENERSKAESEQGTYIKHLGFEESDIF